MGRKTSKRAQSAGRTRLMRPSQLPLGGVSDPVPIISASIVPPNTDVEPHSRRYGFVRGRQLEGTFPGEPGTGIWPITHLRTNYGWGILPDKSWPDSNDEWPWVELQGLDRIAKTSRRGHYQRTRNLEDCKQAMVARHLPQVSFEVTEHWFHANDGVIPEPSHEHQVIGAHAVMLFGYDDHSRTIKFANPSWGQEWGDQGIGTLSYNHFKKRSVEAWIQSPSSSYTLMGKRAIETQRSRESEAQSFYELDWITRDILRGEILSVFEVYDFANDERIGWAFAVPREGFLDIEEFFVRPAYRRRGYASRLAASVLKMAKSLNRPIRLWVSYADCGRENRAALDGLLKKLGLSLWNSPVRWAAYVGLADSSPHELDPIVMPDRPAMSRAAWKAAQAAVLVASLAAGPSRSMMAEPAPVAVKVREEAPGFVDDTPPSQAPDDDQVEDDVPPGVEYDVVLATPPSEIIPFMARIVSIVRGRQDLPMTDEEWQSLVIEDDED